MINLLFVVILNIAHADIGPPPKCPEGEYRTYLRGHQCVRSGYVLIDLMDFNIPWEIVEQIEAGELVIPELERLDLTINRGSIEVKKEDEAAMVQILQNINLTTVEKIVPVAPKVEDINPEKASKKVQKKTKHIPVEREKTERIKTVDQKNKDCSFVSVTQSGMVLIWAVVFSSLRRRR